MNCMKCGCETTDSHVFCDSCLEIMAQYPVKPGTPVHIPIRKSPLAEKKVARRQDLSPKEQLRLQRRTIRRLRVLLILAILAALLFAALLLYVKRDSIPAYLPDFIKLP